MLTHDIRVQAWMAAIIAGTALALLLTTCAPDVAPSTMAATVAVESGINYSKESPTCSDYP